MVTLRIPDALALRLAALADRFAARTGERARDVRRGVEISCMQRGIEAIELELDEAERVEADAQKRALG